MKSKTLLPLLTAIAASSLPIQAAVIFAFNAEDGSSANTTVIATLGADFDPPLSNASALGGEYITTETNGAGDAPGNSARVASYTISFGTAGNYDLYGRFRAPTGNDDSLFVGNGFGTKDVTAAGEWLSINGLSGTGANYTWVKLTGPANHIGTGTETIPTYNVAAVGDLIFQIGAREDGLIIDAFAFGTSGESFTGSQLDAAITTAIPEPSAALLGGLGMLFLLRRRR